MRSAMRQVKVVVILLIVSWCVLGVICSSSPAPHKSEDGGDSLRGALEALDRRQRALQHHPRGPGGRYRYPALQPRELENEEDDDDIEFMPLESGQPEDIGYGFQRGVAPGSRHDTRVSPAQLERLLLQYLDEGTESDSDEHWSPFREREDQAAEEDDTPASMFRERQHEEKRSATTGDDRYLQLLAALWNKYQTEVEEQQEVEDSSLEKRQDGYGYGDGYDFYNSPMGWGDGHFSGYKRSAENDPWFPAFELVPRERTSSVAKRFPVTKRSSSPPLQKKPENKVAADLAEIFEKKSNNSNSSTSTPTPTVAVTTGPPPHAAMHKKSVDWSQYFGIDRRRKKSSPSTEGGSTSEEEEDQEETERRIMEQYYRTLALATSVKRKRSGEPTQQQQQQQPSSLEGMDQKLKAMEDLIVDEAVKFTGAHQGSADPKEIKTVKEQVLSRLAAAYSLEKMRQALDEFRESLGHGEKPPSSAGEAEKRRPHETCSELRALTASCARVQPAFAEPCTWYHACQQCAGSGQSEMCDTGFLRAAEQECEGRPTCVRGARRLLSVVSRAGPRINVPCASCVRRFLETRRRR